MANKKLSNFKITAVAVTDASQGGACSGENDSLLFKAKKEGVVLTAEQKALLKELGYEESEINKSLLDSENALSSPSGVSTGEDNLNLKKGTDNDMSDELVKSLEAKVKVLEAREITKAVSAYEFSEEVAVSLAEVMGSIEAEQRDVITKALDEIKAKGAEAVELEKAKVPAPVVEEDNELTKALSKEAGDGGEPEAEPELNSLQKALAAQKVLQSKESK